MYGSWFPWGVDAVVERVPLQHPGRRIGRGHRPPGGEDRQLRVQVPVPAALDIAQPAVEAGCLGLAIQLFFPPSVLREELLQIMGRHVRAHGAAAVRLGGLAAANRRAPRQDVHEEEVRLGKLEDDGVVVALVQAARLSVHHEVRMRRRLDILVQVHIVVPEDEVIRREGLAVGPLHPFPEEDDHDLAVVAHLPVPGHAGHDLCCGVVPEQDLVRRANSVPVLRVRRPGERPPPGPAVLPDRLQRLYDHGLLGDALLHGGKLPGLH